MTPDELASWRAKSEQLRRIVNTMEPGPDRAAIAFCAGAMLGLANRVHAFESIDIEAEVKAQMRRELEQQLAGK